MTQLREAVEKRKSRIIRDLIKTGYTKYEDGRQLYELPLAELEHLYISMRIEKCRSLPVQQGEE
ncbi:Fur-regulated basic protein FbpA [Neobacillus niacini]|uniref:Fur-regulated basic protein FbpA n=1 Tax=Neobacillus niacini TaxID=86668 RepID=UPI002FFE5566